MLYQTAPDASDGHIHAVEIDDQGDGVTDESGDMRHVHEVYGGAVEPFESDDYASDHPGKIEPLEDEGADQPTLSSGASGSSMGPSEGILTAVQRVQLGEDPILVARHLLFG